MNVSLFVTCLSDVFAPDAAMAAVEVLEHFGCTVDFPAAQTCCGQPQFNNGYPRLARPLARRMIRVFADSTCVVTPSASCCAMVREHYPALFKDAPEEADALAFAAKTYEFVEFLTKVLKVDVSSLKLPDPTTLTYHYVCHTRALNIPGDPGRPCINLVEQLQNATFVPLNKAEQCCGFGGTFALKYPDISGEMVQDKLRNGNDTKAAHMIVNDAGCAMNIGGACHRHNAQFTPIHIAQLLAMAIRPETKSR